LSNHHKFNYISRKKKSLRYEIISERRFRTQFAAQPVFLEHERVNLISAARAANYLIYPRALSALCFDGKEASF